MEIITPPAPQPQYAGFWLRFGGLIIDSIVISFAQSILFFSMLGTMGLKAIMEMQNQDMEDLSDEDKMMLFAGMLGTLVTFIMAACVVQWLYFAIMESSSKQGTLGKMAVGIKVTDQAGNRISFLRATGRHFGKIISGMILCVGYLMAAFTEKKQALHDLMAGCLVVKK